MLIEFVQCDNLWEPTKCYKVYSINVTTTKCLNSTLKVTKFIYIKSYKINLHHNPERFFWYLWFIIEEIKAFKKYISCLRTQLLHWNSKKSLLSQYFFFPIIVKIGNLNAFHEKFGIFRYYWMNSYQGRRVLIISFHGALETPSPFRALMCCLVVLGATHMWQECVCVCVCWGWEWERWWISESTLLDTKWI